jgi:cellobiose phosphorylase
LQLLSNGRYHVAVTGAGGGSTRYDDLALTRWRDDATCDHWGSFLYVRDLGNGAFWSIAQQPVRATADASRMDFAIGRAAFHRRDGDVESGMTIVVAPDDDVELRRVTLVNHAAIAKTIDVTSYAEVVLAPPDVDAEHPAFAKLFVETAWDAGRRAILCRRRPRETGTPAPWMFHRASMPASAADDISFETDRLHFIGRGRTPADPRAMHEETLSGRTGPVLDPVAAIRVRVAVEPGGTAIVDFCTGIAATRDACNALLDQCAVRGWADAAVVAAPEAARKRLRALDISDEDATAYRRMAVSVMYANATLRADASVVASNRRGQSGLWGHGISGDFPVVLLQIADAGSTLPVRQLVTAQRYWRQHGLVADLAIVCVDHDGQSAVHAAVAAVIEACGESARIGRRGGIYVLDDARMDDGDRILLQTVARVVIDDRAGSLVQQLARRVADPVARVQAAGPLPAAAEALPAHQQRAPRRGDLVFSNGHGGFTADGQEYVITTSRTSATPAPWVNVIANPSFGTLVSESGSSNTWSENAHEFRLTPWSNDSVADANTEALYLRDESSGRFWSPTLLPCGGDAPHTVRHGFGYSVFEHTEDGIASELSVFVAIDAAVKFTVLKVVNRSGRRRALSVTGYVEWVLGDLAAKTRMHVVTERDDASGLLLARNAYSTDFADRVAFFDTDPAPGASHDGDRTTFLGCNGALDHPAALSAPVLGGHVGATLDPCAAIRVPFELAEGETREIIFRLGAAPSATAARVLALRTRGSNAAHVALAAVREHWQHTLGAIEVQTPEPALDLMANGWLLYQILSCRMWARNAFYQSSGAYGFRDQLQDAMALVYAEPALVREHLLRCASRQFGEGDVQHWWHPPSGRGVRTHCSDDYLWLPFAACHYVRTTADTAVLDEAVPFIEGNAPAVGDSVYELPRASATTASLYDHCVRAIEHGLRMGAHGLPLMGAGDWNDGMNLVGAGGKGESVWLGWFLCAVLAPFGELATQRGDTAFAQRCRSEVARRRASREQSWDGGWYRRAYFDDGSPLGSAANAECSIDSIAQSWAVLSGAGDAAHARTAMDAVDRMLVHRDAGLVQLLEPPFDHFEPNPGYIKGYLPGVRENGAQYTHAAVWVAMAFATLGDAARAWDLFTMLDPVDHARSPEAVATWMTEPYVMASDVYSRTPHVGRGGWTWYTGSAGWMYRLVVESLLGLHVEGGMLEIAPCMPPGWAQFAIRYRHHDTCYRIAVRRLAAGQGATRITVDGAECDGARLTLANDGCEHSITVDLQCAHH